MLDFTEITKLVFSKFKEGQRIGKQEFADLYFSNFPSHNLNDFYFFRRLILAKKIIEETMEKDFYFSKKNFDLFLNEKTGG